MKNLLRVIIKTGTFLVIIAIASYIWMFNAEQQAAVDLCNNYPAGSHIEDLNNLQGASRLKKMGPINNPDNPEVTTVIFCVSTTMCDTSCSFDIEDNIVKNARFSRY